MAELGFTTPTALYSPNGVEGMLVDTGDFSGVDFVVPAPKNGSSAVAQVDTIDTDLGADATYTYTYTDAAGNATTVTFVESGGGGAAAVGAGIAAAINANSTIYADVVATVATNDVVITAREAGTAFAFTSAVSGGTATVSTTTTAADNALIPFGRVVSWSTGDADGTARTPNATGGVIGITVRTDAHERSGTGVDGYKSQEAMKVARKAPILVKADTAIDPTSAIYYYHTGAKAGQIRAGSDASATALPNSTAFSSAAAGGLVKLNFSV